MFFQQKCVNIWVKVSKHCLFVLILKSFSFIQHSLSQKVIREGIKEKKNQDNSFHKHEIKKKIVTWTPIPDPRGLKSHTQRIQNM